MKSAGAFKLSSITKTNIVQHEQCHMREQCLRLEVCPMVLVQGMLSGKWKILILWYLSFETLRFSDIKRKLPNITQKMLTQQLRNLEEDKLIFRKVYPVVPPRVEYGLTDVGKKTIPILQLMHKFGSEYFHVGFFNDPKEYLDAHRNEDGCQASLETPLVLSNQSVKS